MNLKLQEWVHRLEKKDKERLQKTLANLNPKEFVELMFELRKKYSFIPDPPKKDSK